MPDHVLSEDFFGRLNVPVVGEADALEELRKAGASEEDVDAATWAFRLLASLPDVVAKSLDSGLELEPEPIEKSPEERERIAAEAREFNARVQKRIERSKLEKAEQERRASRSHEERMADLDDAMKRLEITVDSRAQKEIDEAAKRIRKADPSLTEAQSVVKALEHNPDLYAKHQRHQLRQMGALNDDPREVWKEQDVHAPLYAAAAELRKADPALTEAKSVAMALEQNPDLYQP